ncbi:putative RNA-binding protein [Colletotrichum trifolii]|uniref:Putative RNA-binding protein n=1 Tax=Colletotrichum trifolii TaxID=5466 RepID=A0A4R8R6H1_COLTR|nr:putative RNA-binding protein [Colletotrichum trifolii]
MNDATPEYEATAADLSPVSPSPLYSAAPAVVPALQDTADILDAMSTHNSGVVHADMNQHFSESQAVYANSQSNGDGDGNGDDADSLDDAYGDDDEDTGAGAGSGADKIEQQREDPDDDDYLKMLDSDLGGVEEEGAGQYDVSNTREFMHNAAESLKSPSHPPVAAATATATTTTTAAAAAVVPGDRSATSTASTHPGAESFSNGHNAHVSDNDPAVDITRLVAEMTGQATEVNKEQTPMNAATASVTLPPRPPMPSQAAPIYPAEYTPQQNTHVPTSTQPFVPATHIPAAPVNAHAHTYHASNPPNANHQGAWDKFLDDERQYMADAKWDKFPEGSRIFIGSQSLTSGRPDGAIDFFSSGNLSSERVSKRDVFDLFGKYGRLAQISLKSAYGFVQYHNQEAAQAAIDELQGIEIKGRKIHIEISRTQKKKDAAERNRSPDRGRGRQGRQERHDQNHENRRGRDDYRPSRNSPPRSRNGYGRDDNYGQGRDERNGKERYNDAHDRSRGRSRSPPAQGRHDYRRREASPQRAYHRGHASEDRLDIPRRHGNDVPDVQMLLLQEVGADFVGWVEREFTKCGLKVAVMFFNPTFSRDAIVQRQVVEGVHAIVDLDKQAHQTGKISLRVFDRSSGVSARYDDYAGVDPSIAAQLTLRAKNAGVPTYPPTQQIQQPYPGYQPPQYAYPGVPVPSYQAPQMPQLSQMPQAPQMPQATQVPQISAADLESVMKHVDNATLQRILGAMGPQQAAPAPMPAQATQALYTQAPPQASPNGHTPAPSGSDQAAITHNIMLQLAKYRH